MRAINSHKQIGPGFPSCMESVPAGQYPAYTAGAAYTKNYQIIWLVARSFDIIFSRSIAWRGALRAQFTYTEKKNIHIIQHIRLHRMTLLYSIERRKAHRDGFCARISLNSSSASSCVSHISIVYMFFGIYPCAFAAKLTPNMLECIIHFHCAQRESNIK